MACASAEADPVAVQGLRDMLNSRESALDFFFRLRSEVVRTGIPFLDSAPSPRLPRPPLRPGQVLELAGPSGSAKSELLLHCATACLVRNRSAAQEHSQELLAENQKRHGVVREQRPQKPLEQERVFLLDSDLKFNVSRLRSILQQKLRAELSTDLLPPEEDGLLLQCLGDLRVFRCHSTLGIITALNAVLAKLERTEEARYAPPPVVLIDSISAFYWPDRAVVRDPTQLSGFGTALPLSVGIGRVAELVKELTRGHRALVVATKACIFHEANTNKANPRVWVQPLTRDYDPSSARVPSPVLPVWREHMPRAWQDVVSMRLHLQQTPTAAGATAAHSPGPVFVAQWESQAQAGPLHAFQIEDGFVLPCD